MTRTNHGPLASGLRATGRRAGFTLTELLVVIAIIAIILALSGAALQKAVESQKNRSSEDLLNKLQPALVLEYDAIVKRAEKDKRDGTIPQPIIGYCDGNLDRAQCVWTAILLR